MKRKIGFAQIIWSIAGVMLFLASYLAFITPDNELLNIAWELGLAMSLAGFANILVYIKEHNRIHGVEWLLADGMSTVALSFFPLFNKMIISAVIPFFFGVWELFSGVLKVIDSKGLREEKIIGWHGFLAIGLIEFISGGLSMIKPLEETVGMNHVIAVVIFIQGVGYISKTILYPQITDLYKKIKF